jgi:hypothetical protein
MIVICINNSHYPLSLEVNKEYKAIKKEDFYIILDENHEEYYYPCCLFEIKYF